MTRHMMDINRGFQAVGFRGLDQGLTESSLGSGIAFCLSNNPAYARMMQTERERFTSHRLTSHAQATFSSSIFGG
ncbi:hypothetical protein ABA45_14125 [Marinobacter psychrophilus]|uniref:Uncharacterized protein n=1 Tax=Marinobacter psychrophilus TaxID=330734 RepID=A0A0H4I349_9GAMM|nr:hypothetical protein ABA45_14125 [Marinobacter psychrophilus]